MKNIEIIPAILPKDFDDLERKLALLKDVFSILGDKEKPIVQVDLCDGLFVPTKTWPFSEGDSFEELIKFGDNFDFEIDLFVKDSKDLVAKFQKIGVKRIVLNIKSLGEQFPSELFNNFDVELTQFGFSVDLGISMKYLDQYVRDADFFQFMGISNVGYQGEKFNSGVLKKIRVFRENNPEVIISVDGGVNLKNAKSLILAGANRLVVGSALFGNNEAEEIADIMREFRKYGE